MAHPVLSLAVPVAKQQEPTSHIIINSPRLFMVEYISQNKNILTEKVVKTYSHQENFNSLMIDLVES
jgi:hypothetical protein